MDQNQPSVRSSNTEASDITETSREKYTNGPDPADIARTLNLREAQQEFGLSVYAIYRAVKLREIKAIQPGGKGRIYYLEDELRALAERRAHARFFPSP